MIRVENLHDVLSFLGYRQQGISDVWSISFPNCCISVDFVNKRINYPSDLNAHRETTKNFSSPENFVVLECITRLLSLGYIPKQIELEKPMPGGHADTGGYCDVIVKDNNGDEFLLIECKTADEASSKEFSKAWSRMQEDGGQLFNYFNSYRKAKALCLYASDWDNDKCTYVSHIVSMEDNEEYLRADGKLKGYGKVAEEKGGKEEYFKVWRNTYDCDYSTVGIFEKGIAPFTIGKRVLSIEDLRETDGLGIQKKYHEYATIMRQHNVSGRENAFDKLVNLFLAKIVDEAQHPDNLQFYWRGATQDDYYSLQDRLQRMYSLGMKEFLGEEVTYIDNKTIADSFYLFKNDPDATKDKILDYFQQLKFYTNNDFAFLDVHNQVLFRQNAEILKKVVRMLQDIRLRTEKPNQFLGDLFEGFLDQGVKQSEGQFFTPMPIVRFIISALPLEAINDAEQIPKVIDYACGAGHFLNEYAEQVKALVEQKNKEAKDYYAQIYGIEKEYRLSKVAKVSAFMYGQDNVNIIYQDALRPNTEIKDGTFSVLIANPPYSVKGFLETLSEEERAAFTLSAHVSDISANNCIEVFFIERAAQLLKVGGVAAIILPSSVLSNGNIYSRAREIILQQFEIISIVEFASGTFGKTGTNTITLFLRKRNEVVPSAEHYANRVQAWFKGDFAKDGVFEDDYLLDDYCQMQGISKELYVSLLCERPNEALWEHDLFKAYRTKYSNDTEAKRIARKRITAKYTAEQQQKEIENYVVKGIRSIEADKLYYYLLAKSYPQPVLIVKSPSDKAESKKFLGYEWSSRKGDEGIKYLNSSVETGEDDLKVNKGLESIQTPLFNPANLSDSEYINSLIRSCYIGNPLPISDTLNSYCSTIRMEEMIDFKQTEWNLAFSVSPTKKKISVFSKYPIVRMENFPALVSKGASITKKKAKKGEYKVVAGGVSYAYMHNEFNRPENTITISASGANAGYVNFWKEKIFASDCTTINVDNIISAKYIFDYLKAKQQSIFSLSRGAAQPHVYPDDIKTFPIPLPPISVQQQIVDECAKVDEEYESSRMAIEEYRNRITQIFVDLEVLTNQNKGGYRHLIINDIGKIMMCRRILKSQTSPLGEVPFYKIGTFGGMADAYISYALYEEYKHKYPYPRKGEVLISAAGTIGKAVVYNGEQAYYQDSNIVWVHNDESKVKNSFLYYAYQHIEWNPTIGGTISRLYNKDLAATKIPVPPIDEQERIVSEIKSYESLIAKAQTVMDSCAKRKTEILKRYLQ